jgi:hypothetical protein
MRERKGASKKNAHRTFPLQFTTIDKKSTVQGIKALTAALVMSGRFFLIER